MVLQYAAAGMAQGQQPPAIPESIVPMHIPTAIRHALIATVLITSSAYGTDITGAGSTFVYPVLAKWSAAYGAQTGSHVNYQSIGSGGGIAQIRAGTVDFGASDKPLAPAELTGAGLGQFPVVIGGIVPVMNLDGIGAGMLKLDGATLGSVFIGAIKTWNDPAIAALNPGVRLPDARITIVHRSDGSGTTFNFTNYLSKVSPAWKAKVGEGAAVQWPAGIGGKGNEGVAAYVMQIKGAIGYVEYAYAVQNTMAYAQMKNAAGVFVRPDAKTFQAAADTADWQGANDFNLIMTDAPGVAAWPITATTWVIMTRRPKNAERTRTALDFFKWSLEHGQPLAASLDYVPLPASLAQRVESYWRTQFAQ